MNAVSLIPEPILFTFFSLQFFQPSPQSDHLFSSSYISPIAAHKISLDPQRMLPSWIRQKQEIQVQLQKKKKKIDLFFKNKSILKKYLFVLVTPWINAIKYDYIFDLGP